MRHRRFISQFVSELYAILIGIGIANVIFTLRIDFNNWFEIVMAVFVTVIVSLYWWDWAAYVEDHFVATPTEFAIDFASLIVLEFLFVHFQEPVRLAGNFLALGLVDLVWVVHHIHHSPDQTYSLRRLWLEQKALAVAIYGGGLLLVLALGDGAGGVVPGLLVMGTAFLVRVLCFREVRRRDVRAFRAARGEDARRIAEINRAYVDPERSDGFLLGRLLERDVRALLTDGSAARLFVAAQDSRILAYAKVSCAVDEDILGSLTWLDPFLERGVRSGPVLHIEQVAVDPRHAGEGLGRRFYDWLIRNHPGSVPCAFVALRPRSNVGSLRFHAAMGFEKAAVFRRAHFLGQEGYESVLQVLSSCLPDAPGLEEGGA